MSDSRKAGVFAVPARIYLAGRTGIALAFIMSFRIIPGTPGRSDPFSGIFYKEIVLEKDPGNGTQSARSAWKDGANV